MFVEFERPVQVQVHTPESGEDEGYGTPMTEQPAPSFVSLQPQFVTAFFESREPGISVIHGVARGGLLVKGTYAEVKAKLWGHPVPASEGERALLVEERAN